MSRPISTEGVVFWTLTIYVATFAILWVVQWIDDFLRPRDKLRKKLKRWCCPPLALLISTACLATLGLSDDRNRTKTH